VVDRGLGEAALGRVCCVGGLRGKSGCLRTTSEKIVCEPARHAHGKAIEFRLGALLNNDDVVGVE
jgi:hypothetical protein